MVKTDTETVKVKIINKKNSGKWRRTNVIGALSMDMTFSIAEGG